MADKIEKWLCSSCEFLLGYVENKSALRVKRKDLFIQIQGGSVTMNCCRCGKVNHLTDHPSSEINLKEQNQVREEENKNGL